MGIVLALSGGADSTVLLAHALQETENVQTVSFMYGSKHNTLELDAACKIAAHYKVQHRIINLASAFSSTAASDSSLMSDGKLPTGHYDDPSMKSTVVPGRNLIFVAVLASIAESLKLNHVWLGIHKGDWNIYPDCRLDWFTHAKLALSYQSEDRVELSAPFQYLTKQIIIKYGMDYNVPFQWTRTCYTGLDIACGECGSCQERLEAFHMACVDDPLEYKTRKLIQRT